MTSISLPSDKAEAMVEAQASAVFDAIRPYVRDFVDFDLVRHALTAALSVPAPGTGGAETVGEYAAVEAAINEARRLEQAGVSAGSAAPSVIRAYLEALSTPPAPTVAVDGEVMKALLADDIVGRIVDSAIDRCRALPDYAGRPAWEVAVEEAIREAIGAKLAALKAPAPEAVAPKGTAAWQEFDHTTIDYVLKYGGRCRECADHHGLCPNGLPCDVDDAKTAIRWVLKALNYGIANGFLQPPVPSIPQAGDMGAVKVKAWDVGVDDLVRDVAEWTDRTSPADYPGHLLITPDELKQFARDVAELSSTPVGEMDGWQTMESAPKDGRNVLLCFHHHPVAIGRFEYGSWTYAFCVTEVGDSPIGWMPVPGKRL